MRHGAASMAFGSEERRDLVWMIEPKPMRKLLDQPPPPLRSASGLGGVNSTPRDGLAQNATLLRFLDGMITHWEAGGNCVYVYDGSAARRARC